MIIDTIYKVYSIYAMILVSQPRPNSMVVTLVKDTECIEVGHLVVTACVALS